MPTADVAVIGAGLAGLAAAIHLADRGARVTVLAAGHAATHWAAGPIDVAAPGGVATPAEGVALLARQGGHPYMFLAGDVAPAVDRFLAVTAESGLPHAGSLDAPLRSLPTGIGSTRQVGIVPAAQADALIPWAPGERLVVFGPVGFKDLWPAAVAASLERLQVWGGGPGPAGVLGLSVELPGLAGRRNLTSLVLAEQFDDPAWRSAAFDAIAQAVDAMAPGQVRIGLPAALGLTDHAAVLADARARLGRPIIELPLVPPGVPGLRLYQHLRSAARARGVRIVVGEVISRVEVSGRRVQAIATAAAARDHLVRVGALVLATGGLAGGGIVGEPDGHLRETVLDLPVDGPPIDRWLGSRPLDPGSHEIAAAGLRTDSELRPVNPAQPDRGPLFENVRIVGGMLAGQRYLRERCGDGVALASAWRAAASLAREIGSAGAPAVEAGGETPFAPTRGRGGRGSAKGSRGRTARTAPS